MSQFARNSSSCIGLIGLGGLAFTLPLITHAEGFVDDAKATLNLRNAYFNRNFTNPANAQGKAEEWTQSFILDAKSGFTQGTVVSALMCWACIPRNWMAAKALAVPNCCQSTMTAAPPTTSDAWVWR